MGKARVVVELRTDANGSNGNGHAPTLANGSLLVRGNGISNIETPRFGEAVGHAETNGRKPWGYWLTEEGLAEAKRRIGEFREENHRIPDSSELQRLAGPFIAAQKRDGRRRTLPGIRRLIGAGSTKRGPKAKNSERDAAILKMRRKGNMPMPEIGGAFGISKQRVEQILSDHDAPRIVTAAIKSTKMRQKLAEMAVEAIVTRIPEMAKSAGLGIQTVKRCLGPLKRAIKEAALASNGRNGSQPAAASNNNH